MRAEVSVKFNVFPKVNVTDMDSAAAAGDQTCYPACEGTGLSSRRPSNPNPNYSRAWEALILRTGYCDVMARL